MRELERIALQACDEVAVFRIDHFLDTEAILTILCFRFANSCLTSMWNRHFVSSLQIPLAESFGAQGRGALCETAGGLREALQNHPLPIFALLATRPPAGRVSGGVQVVP